VLTGPLGILSVFEDARREELASQMCADMCQIGKRGSLSVSHPGFALKLFPVCSAAQAAGELLQNLLSDAGVSLGDAAKVKKVTVWANRLVRISLRYDQPKVAEQAQFSMPFTLACILCHGSVEPWMLDDFVRLQSSEFLENQAKVSLVEVPAKELRNRMTEAGVAEHLEDINELCEGCAVELELANGTSKRSAAVCASGDPRRPMSEDALAAKVTKLCGEGGGKCLLTELRSAAEGNNDSTKSFGEVLSDIFQEQSSSRKASPSMRGAKRPLEWA